MSPSKPQQELNRDVDQQLARELIQVTTRLGDAVRTARGRRGWSLAALGSASGLSRAAIGRIEGGRPATLDTYLRLAHALGLEPTFDLQPRRRKERMGDQDPVHAAMGEVAVRHLTGLGRQVRVDEPYQHYQFAGRADVLAIDHDAASLLHLELRTRLPNIGETAGSFNAKCTWLGDQVAASVGLRRFRSETHVLVLLWSSEVLHTLRLRTDTMRAMGPAGAAPFERWWGGLPPDPGKHRGLVVIDPIDRGHRHRRWVDLDAALTAHPRYRGYADALAALRDAGLA